MSTPKGYLVSYPDYLRIQNMLRWYEREHRNLKPYYRRRSLNVVSGGGGVSVQWAIVTQVPEYNEPTKAKFIVQKAAVDTDSESETYNEWVGDETDIDIERALGFEGCIAHEGDNTAKDIRNWHPWPPVGAIVPIIQKWDYEQATPALRWYMDIDLIYGGGDAEASIRVDDETLLPQAVWA